MEPSNLSAMGRANVYVRPFQPGTATHKRDLLLIESAMQQSGNDFPEDALSLPSTQIMFAEVDGLPRMIQPFYRSLVMGSICPVNGASDVEIAAAMHAMTAAAYTDCHRFGLLDVLAFSNTERTRSFALRHGYEVPQHPPLRLEVR